MIVSIIISCTVFDLMFHPLTFGETRIDNRITIRMSFYDANETIIRLLLLLTYNMIFFLYISESFNYHIQVSISRLYYLIAQIVALNYFTTVRSQIIKTQYYKRWFDYARNSNDDDMSDSVVFHKTLNSISLLLPRMCTWGKRIVV